MFKYEFSLKSNLMEEVVENIVTVDEPNEWNDDEEIIDLDITFINPSQDDNNSKEELFQCDKCYFTLNTIISSFIDFASARKDNINNHIESNHNWCSECVSSFNI